MKLVVGLFTFLCLSQAIIAYKNKDGNDRPERKFKSGKVQELWEKANKMNLPSLTLTDLYTDLRHFDHEWMEMKARQEQSEDGDKQKQAKMQKEYNAIMFKYGLAGNDREEETSKDKISRKMNKDAFEDHRLNSLWKKAQASGKFSQSELDKLFLEFKHHEDKLTELYKLKASKFHTDTNLPPEEDDQMSHEEKITHMKELYKDVEMGYKRLHTLTAKDGATPFADPRVLELWKMVKQGNFSEGEKRSLEEELRHYERRIDKHRHFREELRNSAEKVKFHEKHSSASPEKLSRHEKLQNKVLEMTDMLHKTYTSFKKRLSPGVIRHREL